MRILAPFFRILGEEDWARVIETARALDVEIIVAECGMIESIEGFEDTEVEWRAIYDLTFVE